MILSCLVLHLGELSGAKYGEYGCSLLQGDRRKSRRFSLRLPVVVRWTDENLRRETRSETQDVSSHGLRFVLPTWMANGSLVHIFMTLPYQVTGVQNVLVDCQLVSYAAASKIWTKSKLQQKF
jgi:hypothetical protein